MSENLGIWNQVCRPPKEALKTISGGRISGMTNISPQWRSKIMTERFGPVGIGWNYTIDELWMVAGSADQMVAFARVSVTYVDPDSGEWSKPIPGVGGSMFITQEKNGPYTSDEAYKMAITDGLSVALKALGVAADIYMGDWDGSKYRTPDPAVPPDPEATRLYNENKAIIEEKTSGETQHEALAWLDKYARTVHGMGIARQKLDERFKEYEPVDDPPDEIFK